MISKKILIPIFGSDVAPRFDLATEILVTHTDSEIDHEKEKIIVLPQASAEQLCHQILTEGVQVVVCGAIEEEYYHYLIWKKVEVIDSVIGTYNAALATYKKGELSSGAILKD